MSNGSASSSNRRGKAKTSRPWTTTEEITLCTTWCKAMENYGTGDMKKGFWSEESTDEHEIYDEYLTDGYPTEKEQHQLLLDEETLRETLEEEATAEKELEERIKQEQTHDELFMLEFRVKSDSEYESD
ncbi:hypothetical protein Tco_0489832 [Tanacetum coccineum]